MLNSVVKLGVFLNDECSEVVAEAIMDAIAFRLQHCDESDFTGGELDKFILLSLLFACDISYLKPEYDPACNFIINFFDQEDDINECEV